MCKYIIINFMQQIKKKDLPGTFLILSEINLYNASTAMLSTKIPIYIKWKGKLKMCPMSNWFKKDLKQ